MPWSDLALHLLGLLGYPGLLAMVAAGLVAEAGAARALGRAPASARSLVSGLGPRGALRSAPPLAATAVLLALLAATQVAAPYSPVPAPERNLLVAGVALAAAAWLSAAWGWSRPRADPALLLLVQLCWLVALLAPAVVPENLRPQVLGAVVVRQLLPLKISAAVLFALCLPVLLELIEESIPQARAEPGGGAPEGHGFSTLRVFFWLPYCGLFSSLFFPPGDDPVGVMRFAATTAGIAALSILLAVGLKRRPPAATRRLYARLVTPFALFTIGVAILTALLT